MAPCVTLRESCRMPIAGSRSRTICRATSTSTRQRHRAERLEDGRQAVPVERVVGDDQRLEAGLGAIDAAEADVAGVAEVDQAADAIADRRFLVGELRHQLQVLDRVAAGVGDAHTRAEPVLERRGGSGAVARSRQSGHGRLYGCSPARPAPGRPSTPVSAPRGLILQAANQHRVWLDSEQKSTPIHVIHMVKKCRTANCRDEMC